MKKNSLHSDLSFLKTRQYSYLSRKCYLIFGLETRTLKRKVFLQCSYCKGLQYVYGNIKYSLYSINVYTIHKKQSCLCVHVCCINSVKNWEIEREKDTAGVSVLALAKGLTNVYNKVLRGRFIPSTSPHLIKVGQTPPTHTSRVQIEGVQGFVVAVNHDASWHLCKNINQT